MSSIQLHDKHFRPFITSEKIAEVIGQVAQKIQKDYREKNPLFIGVLNGSFLFAADLVRHFDGNCEVSFIKLASYEGTSSTGTIQELIGFNESLEGRDVIVIEDIVDTGNTLERIYQD